MSNDDQLIQEIENLTSQPIGADIIAMVRRHDAAQMGLPQLEMTLDELRDYEKSCQERLEGAIAWQDENASWLQDALDGTREKITALEAQQSNQPGPRPVPEITDDMIEAGRMALQGHEISIEMDGLATWDCAREVIAAALAQGSAQ